MKTTIDLPEDLVQRAKMAAVQRKTTLKDLVILGLSFVIHNPPEAEEGKRKLRAERLLAALGKGRNTEPVGPLHREEIYDRHGLC